VRDWPVHFPTTAEEFSQRRSCCSLLPSSPAPPSGISGTVFLCFSFFFVLVPPLGHGGVGIRPGFFPSYTFPPEVFDPVLLPPFPSAVDSFFLVCKLTRLSPSGAGDHNRDPPPAYPSSLSKVGPPPLDIETFRSVTRPTDSLVVHAARISTFFPGVGRYHTG